MNATGTVFPTALISRNFSAQPPLAAGTSVSGALGMQSQAIKDCQISASESPDPTRPPKDARLGGTSGWTSASRLGAYGRYLDVHFANLTRVTSIQLEHPGYSPVAAAVQQYRVHYSNDGINWVPGATVSTGGSYPGSSVTSNVIPAVEATYIRLEILQPAASSTMAMAALKVEFYGSTTATLPTDDDVCNVREGWQPLASPLVQFYRRGFIVAGTTMFFCDSSPKDVMSCYGSSDGLNWQTIDKAAVNIIGYVPSVTQLYGIHMSRRGILVSEDNAVTWMTTSIQRFNWAATQPDFVPSITVPWKQGTGLTNAVPVAPYLATGWGANYNGMYLGLNQKADWHSCCP